MKQASRMLRRLRSALAIAGGCIVVLTVAGCGHQDDAVPAATQTPQQAVATDSRIPPEKQAQIQQIIAQQQAQHTGPPATQH